MKIGFTGTRNGMTPAQKTAFSRLISQLRPDEFRHGACIGADTDSVCVARFLSIPVRIAMPGVFAKSGLNHLRSQAAINESTIESPPMTMFARNRLLVDSSDQIIAAPKQNERPAAKSGGGTWQTIEYAEKRRKRVHIIWPDGRVETLEPSSLAAGGGR
jgi:hypothetical protein